MQVAQRGTSSTGLGAADGYFTLDRYKLLFAATAGRLTMTQTADGPSGFANCLKLDCTTADASIAAGEYMIINHRIEGQDLQQIKKGTSDAERVTISFYVKGNANATYMLEVNDEDNTRINQNQFAVTTDWTRIEITLPPDTTGAFDNDKSHSLSLNMWLHSGSTFNSGTYTANTWVSKTNANRAVGITSFFDSTDRTFFITGLQMEVGSVATPFEHASSFGEQLALCQRYYQTNIIPSGAYWAIAAVFTSTTSHLTDRLTTEIRVAPTASYTGTFDVLKSGVTTNGVLAFSTLNVWGARLTFTTAAVLTIGQAVQIWATSNATVSYDAEL